MIEFRRKAGTWDPAMMYNGFLAGLVAITAPCAFVTPIGAALIGVVAGVLVRNKNLATDNERMAAGCSLVTRPMVNTFFFGVPRGLQP